MQSGDVYTLPVARGTAEYRMHHSSTKWRQRAVAAVPPLVKPPRHTHHTKCAQKHEQTHTWYKNNVQLTHTHTPVIAITDDSRWVTPLPRLCQVNSVMAALQVTQITHQRNGQQHQANGYRKGWHKNDNNQHLEG